MLRLILTNDHL